MTSGWKRRASLSAADPSAASCTAYPSASRYARTVSTIAGASSTDMPAVGSSNMNTCGSSAIMMATSSLRLSPCGSATAATSRLSARLAAAMK